MTSHSDDAVTAETERASAPESVPATVLMQHAAFCRLGLPLAPLKGAWRRDAGWATLALTPGSAGDTLPDGPGLRLIVGYLCDMALRANSPVVAMGADAAALAERMGLAPGAAAPLAEQVERLIGCRLTVSLEDGPELTVLDARSRPRGGGWPAALKLNARFLASLTEHAVALDRAILRALSASAEAMDAHGWMREALSRGGPEAVVTAPWPDLQARFGEKGMEPAAFRDAFESALRLVFEADLSIELAVDDDGVSARHAAPAPAEPAPAPAAPPVAEPPAAPAPVAAPARDEERPPMPEPPREPRDAPEYREQRDREPREPREQRDRQEVREPRGRDREDRRPRREEAAPDQGQADQIVDDMIRLRSHLTGLPQVVWLRRGHGEENILVGVTPGARMDPDRLTILMVEPIVMQVSGGLGANDFERVSAWVMANRDLIDDFWEGAVGTADEALGRVRKAPGPATSWR